MAAQRKKKTNILNGSSPGCYWWVHTLYQKTACMCLCLHVLSNHTFSAGPSALGCFDFSPFLCHRCQAKPVGEIRVAILIQTPERRANNVWCTLHKSSRLLKVEAKKRKRKKKASRAGFNRISVVEVFICVSMLCTLCNLSFCFHSMFCTKIYSVHNDVMPEFATHPSVVDVFCFCTTCIRIWCSPLFVFFENVWS